MTFEAVGGRYQKKAKERKPGCNNPTAIVTRYFMCTKDRSETEQEEFFQHESIREPPSLSKNGHR